MRILLSNALWHKTRRRPSRCITNPICQHPFASGHTGRHPTDCYFDTLALSDMKIVPWRHRLTLRAEAGFDSTAPALAALIDPRNQRVLALRLARQDLFQHLDT